MEAHRAAPEQMVLDIDTTDFAIHGALEGRFYHGYYDRYCYLPLYVKSLQTNGICERFHRTMQDEFYSIAFRKKLCSSLEQLQADLDGWLEEYNQQRPHSGKYCFGKTPVQTFRDSRHLAHEKQLDRLLVVTSPDPVSPRAARPAATVS